MQQIEVVFHAGLIAQKFDLDQNRSSTAINFQVALLLLHQLVAGEKTFLGQLFLGMCHGNLIDAHIHVSGEN